MTPCRVHLIGHAGTGKSSLLPEILRALDEAGEGSAVDGTAAAGDRGIDPAGAPIDAFLAWRLASHPRPGGHREIGAGTWFHVLQKERRRRNAAARWIVVDEGLSNRIRKYCRALPGRLLRALPLPDAVVCLESPAGERYRRVIERDQDIPERKRITGDDRIRRMKNRARTLYAFMSAGEAETLLRQWNDRACNPPLAEDELAAILEAARNEPPRAQRPESYWAWMKPAFERAGVHWIEVTNDDEVDPQELGRTITREIMARHSEL